MASGDQFVLTPDITEQTRLETQLRQAQKMEVIGTMARGIAQDFNNILSAIMGYTELSILGIPDQYFIMDNLNEILKADHRAKGMVRQILAFSRQDKQERIPIQLIPIVKEASKRLRGSLPTTIEVSQHIENGKGIVELHPKKKAIIASGFSETDRVEKTQRLGAGAYVKKPYVLEKIGIAVRAELDQAGFSKPPKTEKNNAMISA